MSQVYLVASYKDTKNSTMSLAWCYWFGIPKYSFIIAVHCKGVARNNGVQQTEERKDKYAVLTCKPAYAGTKTGLFHGTCFACQLLDNVKVQ